MYTACAHPWQTLPCTVELTRPPRHRTAGPVVTLTMREVMKNHQLVGSTMGSHKDLVDATSFLAAHRIVPVVSHVLDGLESAEEGFELINRGQQFGKVVIRIRHENTTARRAQL